jgi:hypothetical protein
MDGHLHLIVTATPTSPGQPMSVSVEVDGSAVLRCEGRYDGPVENSLVRDLLIGQDIWFRAVGATVEVQPIQPEQGSP